MVLQTNQFSQLTPSVPRGRCCDSGLKIFVTHCLFTDLCNAFQSEIQEEIPGHRGDVIIAFKYTPPDGSLGRKGRKTRGRLSITIKEAKNLAPVRANGSADPFCKW